ncbi:MAG: DUF1800 domain-containing protein [Saprospiraceae bacterium]|nr:DUF1800 domain-containing protein [Saprospiraceae bacterium]
MLTPPQKLHHLYQRAGFGLSPREWKRRQHWTIDQAVEDLFREASNSIPLGGYEDHEAEFADMRDQRREMSRQDRRTQKKKLDREKSRLLITGLNRDWVHRMAASDQVAFREKMMLFWHGHFAVQTLFGGLARIYANTLHRHALGRFSDMTLAIATDPAMILFLNNQQNHKDKPNENFTRELMELFTLGRGQYNEQDIREGARAFTGWACRSLQGEFIYREADHDEGEKTFFGKTGNWNGQNIIEMILEKPEAAQFIARKVYRFFVNDTPDEARIRELGQQLYTNGYDITDLMDTIFRSEWFYHPINVGNRIKSPVELIAGLLKTFHGSFDDPTALSMGQAALGQVLFFPPSVAGWSGGKSWIDNQRLLLRLQLPMILFEAAEADIPLPGDPEAVDNIATIRKLKANVDPEPLLTMISGQPLDESRAMLIQYLLPCQATEPLAWLDHYLPHGDPARQMLALAIRICSLPEYQLS